MSNAPKNPLYLLRFPIYSRGGATGELSVPRHVGEDGWSLIKSQILHAIETVDLIRAADADVEAAAESDTSDG